MKRNVFSTLHPALSFGYFAVVLLVTMLVMHPAMQAISLCSAAAYAIWLGGGSAVRFQLKAVLPLAVLMAVINPLFNHRGVTVLFYLNNGNAITWEAVAYGLCAAAMLGGVILWFFCYNRAVSSDQFLYLFGKALPAASLLLSMALRFVPRFRDQIGQVSRAQRALGEDADSGNLLHRARCGLRILSITVTWALENAVVTSDSMKARGYGLRGRTSFSIYRFDGRDGALTGVMLLLVVLMGAGLLTGRVEAQFYPAITLSPFGGMALVSQLSFALFCNLPLLLNGREALKWHSFK